MIVGPLRSLPERLRRRTSTKGDYRPEIDGLRFFAIAIVVVGHLVERVLRFRPDEVLAGPLGGVISVLSEPGTGVLLFFSISGYIIASQYFRQSPYPLGGAYLRNYFVRRLLRIEPPYLLLLTATFILLSLTGYVPPGVHRFNDGPSGLLESYIASLLYSHSWIYGAVPRLFGPGWSLEMEIQFYISAPFLFALYYYCKNQKIVRAASAVALVLATVFSIYFNHDSAGFPHLEYTILHYFLFFFIGVVIADQKDAVAAIINRVPQVVSECSPWIGIVLLVLSGSVLKGDAPYFASSVLIRVAAIFMIFGGVIGARSIFRHFCSRPWISLVGGACYSIYLTHLQIIQVGASVIGRFLSHAGIFTALLLNGAVLVPASVVVGLVFYALVERTFMMPDWPGQLARLMRIRPAPVTGNGK